VKIINKNIKINKYFNPYVYLKKQSFEIIYKDLWVTRTNILTHLSAENV